MKLLLDTHALIWLPEDDPQSSRPAREAIAVAENECYYSLVSIWEMAIKSSLGKLKLSRQLDKTFRRRLGSNGLAMLGIEFEHVIRVGALPWHHRDPFDRLLVAQSEVENMILVSHDEQLDAHAIRRTW